jgi:hypothetical protein
VVQDAKTQDHVEAAIFVGAHMANVVQSQVEAIERECVFGEAGLRQICLAAIDAQHLGAVEREFGAIPSLQTRQVEDAKGVQRLVGNVGGNLQEAPQPRIHPWLVEGVFIGAKPDAVRGPGAETVDDVFLGPPDLFDIHSHMPSGMASDSHPALIAGVASNRAARHARRQDGVMSAAGDACHSDGDPIASEVDEYSEFNQPCPEDLNPLQVGWAMSPVAAETHVPDSAHCIARLNEQRHSATRCPSSPPLPHSPSRRAAWSGLSHGPAAPPLTFSDGNASMRSR